MAMGSFNRKRQYKQENPMANAGVLARLLGQQSQNIDGVSDAIHAQSQNVGRQQVAELMDTDEFNAATPLEKQAMVNAKTGGRNLGDEGRKSLDNTFKMAGDVQSNTWKQDAAELANQNKITAASLLNTRQNARSNKNNVAAMNRVTAKNDGGATGILLSPAAIAEKKEQIKQYDEAMLHPDVKTNPALASNMRRERDTLAGEMIYGAKKNPSAAAVGAVTGVDKNGKMGTSSTGTTETLNPKAKLGKAGSRAITGMKAGDQKIFEQAFQNDKVQVIPGKKKKDGTFEADTVMYEGQPTTAAKVVAYEKWKASKQNP